MLEMTLTPLKCISHSEPQGRRIKPLAQRSKIKITSKPRTASSSRGRHKVDSLGAGAHRMLSVDGYLRQGYQYPIPGQFSFVPSPQRKLTYIASLKNMEHEETCGPLKYSCAAMK